MRGYYSLKIDTLLVWKLVSWIGEPTWCEKSLATSVIKLNVTRFWIHPPKRSDIQSTHPGFLLIYPEMQCIQMFERSFRKGSIGQQWISTTLNGIREVNSRIYQSTPIVNHFVESKKNVQAESNVYIAIIQEKLYKICFGNRCIIAFAILTCKHVSQIPNISYENIIIEWIRWNSPGELKCTHPNQNTLTHNQHSSSK